MDPQSAYQAEPAPELDRAGNADTERGLNQGQTRFELNGGLTELTEPCGNSGCLNPQRHQMEPFWIELMSPVPKPGQNVEPDFADGMARPHHSLFRDIVRSLRPRGVDDHAIETIRSGWRELVDEHLADMPERLWSQLTDLSRTWEGDDFDRFAEQVELVRTNMTETRDEIEIAVGELETLEEQIYAAQGGGGEVPFPAPNVWKANRGRFKKARVHVRPCWAAGGDCDKDRDEGDSWEFMGLPRDTGDRIEELAEARARFLEEHYGMDSASALERAQADYEAFMDSTEGHFSERMREAAQLHNDAILDRRDLVFDSQSDPSMEHSQRPLPSTADGNVDFTAPPLNPPPVPEPPPMSGLGGYDPPPPLGTPSFPDPQSDWSGSQFNPPGAGTGAVSGSGPTGSYPTGTPATSTPSASSGSYPSGSSGTSSGGSTPWSNSGWERDDEARGGLASAGLGGAGGGSTGLGSGLGAGGGAGSAGAGMTGTAGGGMGSARGAGAGAGAGRGTGSARGTGGRGGGMMGAGGRPGGAGSDSENAERDSWLVEDEDVWGITSEEDDPYA